MKGDFMTRIGDLDEEIYFEKLKTAIKEAIAESWEAINIEQTEKMLEYINQVFDKLKIVPKEE